MSSSLKGGFPASGRFRKDTARAMNSPLIVQYGNYMKKQEFVFRRSTWAIIKWKGEGISSFILTSRVSWIRGTLLKFQTPRGGHFDAFPIPPTSMSVYFGHICDPLRRSLIETISTPKSLTKKYKPSSPACKLRLEAQLVSFACKLRLERLFTEEYLPLPL
jgi:hypothetical protein